MFRAVSNTSPINYLLLIGKIGIVQQVYSRVLISPAVIVELRQAESPSAVRTWAAKMPEWVEVRVPTNESDRRLAELGAGERDAILLAQQAGADVLIIDDRMGSAEAQRRGLAVTGTLGVLDRAASLSLVDFPEAMSRLLATNFRIRRDIVETLLKKHKSG